DRGMAVVPTSVHDTFVLGAIGAFSDFLNQQGVDVGPQKDRWPGPRAAQNRQDPGVGDAGPHLQPDPSQLLRDHAGGAALLERQFGVAVEVAPALDQISLQVGRSLAQPVVHSNPPVSSSAIIPPGRAARDEGTWGQSEAAKLANFAASVPSRYVTN